MLNSEIAERIERWVPGLPPVYQPTCIEIVAMLKRDQPWETFLAFIDGMAVMDKSELTQENYKVLAAITSLRGDRERALADFSHQCSLLEIGL